MIRNAGENELLTHLFIEFYYNRKGGVIAEQTRGHSGKAALFERYCMTNGVDEFTRDILYGIAHGHYKFSSRGHYGKDFPIDTVEVRFSSTLSRRLSYTPNETSIGKGPNGEPVIKYMVIVIADDLDLDRYYSFVFKGIVHELTHAIQDNGLSRSGKRLLTQLEKSGYWKYANNDLKGVEKMVSDFFYLLNGFESGANFSELRGELGACRREFETVEEIYDFVKTSYTYKLYGQIIKLSNELFGKENDAKMKEYLLELSRQITNYDFKSYGGLRRYVSRRVAKLRRKMKELVPKIAYDCLSMVRYVETESVAEPRYYDFGDVDIEKMITEELTRKLAIWS